MRQDEDVRLREIRRQPGLCDDATHAQIGDQRRGAVGDDHIDGRIVEGVDLDRRDRRRQRRQIKAIGEGAVQPDQVARTGDPFKDRGTAGHDEGIAIERIAFIGLIPAAQNCGAHTGCNDCHIDCPLNQPLGPPVPAPLPVADRGGREPVQMLSV